MNVFKVVQKNTRYGTNIALYFNYSDLNLDLLKERTKSNKIFQQLFSGYLLTYHKGTIVKARQDTVGIFCFKEYIFADFFVSNHNSEKLQLEIIKVSGIGKPSFPDIVRCNVADNLTELLMNEKMAKYRPPFPGTICFPEVLVLE